MTKHFLGTFVLSGSTTKVTPAPCDAVTFIVPSLSANATTEFETVTIDASGDLKRSGVGPSCPITAVPIMYPTYAQSGTTGDMELDEPVSIEVNRESVRGLISVVNTRAYPDGTNVALVMLGGTLRTSFHSEKGTVVLGTLPPGSRPGEEFAFICSLRGDLLRLSPDGSLVVELVGGGESSLLLDCVRFHTGASDGTIRARFPHRSCLHILPQSLPGSVPISGAYTDLIFPVSLQSATGPVLSCLALTRAGILVPLWDDDMNIMSPLYLSSLVTSQASANPITAAALRGMPEDEFVKLRDMVAEKLSAITFSQLSGEEEGRCMRRNRDWRRTGMKIR